MSPQDRINAAVSLINELGDIDGAHHKQWLLDQVVRLLLAEEYDAWAKAIDAEGFYWDQGIAP
jgi:hypothetical protein